MKVLSKYCLLYVSYVHIFCRQLFTLCFKIKTYRVVALLALALDHTLTLHGILLLFNFWQARNAKLLQGSLRTMIILKSINFALCHRVVHTNLNPSGYTSHVFIRVLRALVCTVLTSNFTSIVLWCLFSPSLTFKHFWEILGLLWVVWLCLWEALYLKCFWSTSFLSDRLVQVYFLQTFVVHYFQLCQLFLIIIKFELNKFMTI